MFCIFNPPSISQAGRRGFGTSRRRRTQPSAFHLGNWEGSHRCGMEPTPLRERGSPRRGAMEENPPDRYQPPPLSLAARARIEQIDTEVRRLGQKYLLDYGSPESPPFLARRVMGWI